MKRLLPLLLLSLCACGKPENGAPGSQGLPGTTTVTTITETTGITVVQLCKNGVTHYPSAFAEVAFCIENKLYGTYWDSKNAWSTEIPPGAYKSTSTSVPCDFTVSANCVVTP